VCSGAAQRRLGGSEGTAGEVAASDVEHQRGGARVVVALNGEVRGEGTPGIGEITVAGADGVERPAGQFDALRWQEGLPDGIAGQGVTEREAAVRAYGEQSGPYRGAEGGKQGGLIDREDCPEQLPVEPFARGVGRGVG